jgi:cytochrome c oxidase assembly factor CtaG
VVHGIAIWVWHVPVLFDAAVASTGLHRLQHLSFLATGLLFWWAMLRGRDYGVACAHVFATMFHMSLLGALITLSSRLWYVPNGGAALAFGLSPIEDQQLGGLIMWIPAGTVYAGAGLVLAGRWIARANTATILEDAHELARR